MSYRLREDNLRRHKEYRNVENVLGTARRWLIRSICLWSLQSSMKKNVRIDIVAGTSIGTVNGAIIVGSKSDHPEKALEDFWMEIAESNPNILPDIFLFEYDMMARSYITKKISAASANAPIFGVPKMFTPIWSLQSWKKWIEGEYGDHDRTRSAVREKKEFPYYQYFNPRNWTSSIRPFAPCKDT